MLSFEKNLYSLKEIQIFADKMGWTIDYTTANISSWTGMEIY